MDRTAASPLKPNDADFTEQGLRRFKPYPEYKDSGVEWLGKIPAHWQGMPLKRWVAIKITDGPHETPEILPEGVPFVSAEAMQNGYINFDAKRGFISEQVHQQYCLKCHPRRDDLFLCKSGATTGKVVIIDTDEEFSVWSPLAQIRPNPHIILPRFLFYALQAEYVQDQVRRCWSAGTQPNIAMGAIEGLFVTAPPLEEQSKFINFIDARTTKLDALIAKKERLIELLQEKRIALISQAVTKGLDPNVPMKDSGIEWLGEIPSHWNLIPLKYCTVKKANAIKTGPFGSQLLSSEMTSGEIKVYNQRTVLDHDFISGDNYITQDKFKDLISFMVEPGDILLTTRGTIGRCAVVPKDSEKGILHPCLMRVQPDISIIVPEYLVLLIQDSILVQTQIKLASNATTIDVIYSETMKEIKIPLPPLKEQLVITAAIDRETSKVDAMIAKIREAIDRLKEYRAALISTAVTGKIDVREEIT